MAKIVLPTTTPYSPEVQSPRLSTAPTPKETFANLVAQVSDDLMKFALKERERQDQLTLAENPLKESIIESYKENFDSTVFNEDGSINYEQSLLRSENILESRDVLYSKAKADVVRKYKELGLSRRVFQGVQSSVIGAFQENDESIRQSILQQQDALKVGYVDKLKLDFTEDPSADIETSLGKMLGVIESMTVEEEKSKQRAEFIQFARSSVVEKASTFDGALQIIGGFESDALNKAVKDVRGVNLSFSTIKNEITSGITKEELSDAEQDFIPIDDAAFEAFKVFSLQLPDNHSNKMRSEAIVNIFQDDLNRQEGLEEINVLIQEGRIPEATQRGKLMSPTVQGAYFGKLMSNMSASNPDQVRAFANVVNYFTDLRSQLPKEIKQQVENFVLSSSFPTNEEKALLRALFQKRDRLILGKDATEVLRTFSGGFEPDGQPAFVPVPDEATIAKRTAAQTGKATETFNDNAVEGIFNEMGNPDLGDEWAQWLPDAINGHEDSFETDRAKAKDALNASAQAYLAKGQTLSEAAANARADFLRDNFFVTINGKIRLIQNYPLESLRDFSGNPVSAKDFSIILEQKIRQSLASREGADEDFIQDQMDELVGKGFFIQSGRNRQLFFFTDKNTNLTSVTIDANEIAEELATNAVFVNTEDLLTLFSENPEFLTTNAGQFLQTPMPSSQGQVRKANSYLNYGNRKGRKPNEPLFTEEDLEYYVDNYPFKNEDPGYLEFVKDLDPLFQIEVLRARTKNIIGMSTGNKYLTHPYTRGLFEDVFDAVLESYQWKDPADAVQKLVNARAASGEPVGFWEERIALYSDLMEETFDFVTESLGMKSDTWDLFSNHKEITEWLGTGETAAHLSHEARSAYYSLARRALEITKETYQLQVNALKTNEERIAFFEENIRKPIELDNYRFTRPGLRASDAIRILKSDQSVKISKADQIQRAFNMMKKTRAENPGESVPNDLNVFLGAENYLYVADLKSTAESMVFEKDIPFNVRGGRNILNWIKQENLWADEKQILDILRFDLADYLEKTNSNPDYAFAFDKGTLLKILDSLGSNDE